MTEPNNRIALLKKYIEDDPGDPFNPYALALEYLSLGEPDHAIELLQNLTKISPDYLPSYYQLGKILEMAGKIDQAINTYRSGYLIAQKAGNAKTASELRVAFESLE